MSKKIVNLFTNISIILLIIVIIAGNTARTEAKIQDGKYNFSPCMVTKFQVKDSILVLKTDKNNTSGITKGNNKNYKKYKLKIKVAKNCKYRFMEYNRGTGESYSGKTDYQEVKKAINEDKNFYKKYGYASNVADSYIKIKNNKVVKIVYVHM